MSCVPPLGDGSWKWVPGFLSTSSRVPFPFANSALCLFTIISHRYKYDHMLSPVSPPTESSNLGCSWGPLNTGFLGDIWEANINIIKEKLRINGFHYRIYLQTPLNLILLICSWIYKTFVKHTLCSSHFPRNWRKWERNTERTSPPLLQGTCTFTAPLNREMMKL